MPQTPTRADLIQQISDECVMVLQNIAFIKSDKRSMKTLEEVLKHLSHANGELLNYWA